MLKLHQNNHCCVVVYILITDISEFKTPGVSQRGIKYPKAIKIKKKIIPGTLKIEGLRKRTKYIVLFIRPPSQYLKIGASQIQTIKATCGSFCFVSVHMQMLANEQ